MTPLRSRRRGVALMIVLVLAVLSYQLNATMVGPLLPLLASEHGVGVDTASMTMSVFFAASAVGGVVFGRWSDSVGRRRALLLVLGLVIAGTLICATAPTFPVLVAGRAVQGLGAAVFPLAYLVVREHLTPRMFGVGIGVLTACNGGLIGVDGILGGTLAESVGSRVVFWVLLAPAVAALVGVALTIARSRPSAPMDWRGAGAVSVALIALSGLVSGLAAGDAVAAGGAAVVLTVSALVFAHIERRAANPLVAVDLVGSRTFWPVLVTTALSLAALQPIVAYTVVILGQDAEAGFGLDAAGAALWFLLPAAAAGVVAAPVAGRLAERLGWMVVLRLGLVFGALAAGCLAGFAAELPAVVVCSIVLGIACNGFVLTAVNGLAVVQSPSGAPASLPSLNGAAFGLGISVGIVIAAPHVSAGTLSGYSTAFALACALAIVALGSTLLIRRADSSLPQGASDTPSSIGSKT